MRQEKKNLVGGKKKSVQDVAQRAITMSHNGVQCAKCPPIMLIKNCRSAAG